MVTLSVGQGEPVADLRASPSPLREGILRILAAVLQIAATVAIVRALEPETAGIYFKGFVIAYGLGALLRGKYELFIAHFFIGNSPHLELGIPARVLVRALGIRVLIRSAIACAILLVVTADLDVIQTHLRPYLETYLPFVLAVPFATLALLLSGALRAVNRTLGSVLVASYSMNIAILVGAWLAPPEDALFVLSWAFFAGSVLMAATGVLITRRVFKQSAETATVKSSSYPWAQVYLSTGHNGLTGIALAGLQWGPACVLAVFGTDLGIAQYAVVYRTAQIIDFLVPSVILIPQSARFQSQLCEAMSTLRGKLAVDLAVSFSTTTAWVIAVAMITPWLIGLYGPPYTEVVALFLLLYATQWVLGGARPAMRQVAAEWDLPRIRRVLLISVAVAVLVTLVGVHDYDALAAAVGVLAGAVIEHAQALGSALRLTGARANQPPPARG
jgi:hypothetical protein